MKVEIQQNLFTKTTLIYNSTGMCWVSDLHCDHLSQTLGLVTSVFIFENNRLEIFW